MKRFLIALMALTTVSLTPAPAQADDPATTLRVATFNIHAGAGADEQFDVARTAAAIKALDASVVALQEVDVHWNERSQWRNLAGELAAELDMWVYFGPIYDLEPTEPGGKRRQFGNAILSSHTITRAENHEITRLSTQDPDPKPEPMPGFPEIEIDVAGTPVHLYSTHLDYRPDPDVRRRQVRDMRRVMNHQHGEAQILMGDFNAGPDARELRPLWRRLCDAWTAAGHGDGLTYPAVAPHSRIDYIATSKRLDVSDARVVETLASDHRPVVADVVIR